MTNEKQRVLNYSNRAFDSLINEKFVIVLACLVAVAFFIDVIPMKCVFDYFNILFVYDKLIAQISYDFSEMTNIMSSLWIFIIGFATFFSERLNEKFYGIRLSDIISSGTYTGRLMCIAGITIVVEPFLMGTATIFQLWHTLCVDFFLMLTSLFVVFLFVLKCSSNSNIQHQIHSSVKDMVMQEKQLKEVSLFFKFLKYADYGNVEDKEFVEYLLTQWVFRIDDKGETEENTPFYAWAYDISEVLLKSGGENSKEILEKCFAVSGSIEFRKGILSAVLDEEKPYDYFYNHLLGIVQNNDEGLQLRYWVIVYELYQSLNMESEWRKVNAQMVFEQYGMTAYQDSVEEKMLNFWVELDNEVQNIRTFYEFINEER